MSRNKTDQYVKNSILHMMTMIINDADEILDSQLVIDNLVDSLGVPVQRVVLTVTIAKYPDGNFKETPPTILMEPPHL